MMMFFGRLCVCVLVAASLLSCGVAGTSSGTQTAQPGPSSMAAPDQAAAASAYCTSKGGTVVTRYPTYDTNNDPSTWVRMNGSITFCEFTAKDGSRIMISADTLWSDKPTLAALAYLQKPAQQGANDPSANPSSRYCSQLGGSDQWGGQNNAAGGGWTTEDSADPFQVANICVFPDMSMIDAWGLTYHTNDIIRGADLGSIFRYRPTNAPNVFQ